jgi:hypothetical protein
MNNLDARCLIVGEMVSLNGKLGVIQKIENNALVIAWLSQANLNVNISVIPYDDPIIAALERPRPSGAM